MRKNAIKIVENNDSNIECTLKNIMSVMITRGISFWCLTDPNVGMIVYIFEEKDNVCKLISESQQFQSFNTGEVLLMSALVEEHAVETQIKFDLTETIEKPIIF